MHARIGNNYHLTFKGQLDSMLCLNLENLGYGTHFESFKPGMLQNWPFFLTFDGQKCTTL